MNIIVEDLCTSVVLRGAYGRKYLTKKSAIADWDAGLDFKITGGGYCSVRDVKLLTDSYSVLLIETDQGVVRL